MTVGGVVGRQLVASVKAATRATAPSGGNCLSLVSARGITLRPIGTALGAASEEEVRLLTEWRNRHVKAFLTEFEATQERTAAWLVESIGPDPGRIVFILRGRDGELFGLCGLAFADWEAGSVELDGVMRGTAAEPGGMTEAVRTLLDWAHCQLGLSTPLVRVVSDNPHALGFYRRLGFVETHRVPLRRVAERGMVRWVPDPSGPTEARQLVHHRMPAGAASTSQGRSQ